MKKIIFLLTLFVGANAWANISIYPYNLDFYAGSRKRVQSIRVINKSNRRQTYRISVIDLLQNSNGDMKEVKDNKNSAKNYLQFSPRQFTLEPNLVQTVNIAQKGLANAPDNEFFSFIQIAETKLGETPKKSEKENKNLSIELIPLFSVRVPVKILKGSNLFSGTDIGSLALKKNKLDVLLKRTGNISSNVNLALLDGKKNEISRLNSVKIYPPNNELKVKMDVKEGALKEDGVLRLEDAVSKKEILTKSVHK